MKKFFVIALLVMVAVMGTGCVKRQAWSTEISSGGWVKLISAKGEVIFNGPEEYVDEQYERDALTESKFNWIWNHEKGDFDKIERGSCKFNE